VVLVALAALIVVLPLWVHPAEAALVLTNGRPIAPAVAYSPRTNSYLLVWAEDRGVGTGLDLYAARTTTTGIVAGSAVPFVVAPGDQSEPALAWSERMDSFLVVYSQTGSAIAGPTPGLPTPGTPSTPGPTPTSGTPPPFQTPPGPPVPFTFAFDGVTGASGDTGALQPPPTPPLPPTTQPPTPSLPTPGPSPTPVNTTVPPPGTPSPTPPVPQPPPSAPGQRDIYGTWSSESGLRLTETFPIIASPADETYPSLAYHRRGNFDVWALVWREVTGTDASISGIELTGYSHFLTITSSKSLIATGSDHGRPSVALEPTGEYVAVWSETPKGATSRDVFARRLNSNVFPRGKPITIVEGKDDMVHPSVASVGSGEGFVVAWEQRASGQPPDIRMRRLNKSGIPLRSEYNIAAGPPFSFSPNVPTTDRVTRLLVWVDRNAASDHSVLGVEINRDGRPLGPTRTLVQGGAGPGAVTPVVPPAPFPTTPPLPPYPPIP
jgi:hypothetical protein